MITKLTLINGETVHAEIIGQLALHGSNTDDDDEGACVSHVASGCLLAQFSDDDDARDFATKADALMDFDRYARLISDGGVAAAKMFYQNRIHAVNELRDSYVTYMRDMMPGIYATRETIRERLQK